MNAPQRAFLLLGQIARDPSRPVEALYGGAAGGGKSDALLMAALQYVDVPGYAALILRRTFKQLSLPDAIMARSKEWLNGTGAVWNEQRKQWVFPSTATLTFGHMLHDESRYDYQGAALQFVGFDELTQFTETQYLYLHSRTRRLEGSGIPIRVFSGSNPGGIGHGWVRRRFVNTKTRQAGAIFIPAKLTDNPHLDHRAYVESLSHLPEVTREQLLNGDWGVFEGMGYPEFDRTAHLVPAFDIPDSWRRLESMDHGVTNPTAWLLIANDYDGNRIVCDSYYQANKLPPDHAKVVLERRKDFWQAKDADGWAVSHSAVGDPASLRESMPIQNEWGEPKTLQQIYSELGVHLVPGNNRRKTGYIEVRKLIRPDPERMFPGWHPRAGEKGAPRLFIVGSRCPELVEQLENAPLAAGDTDPLRGEAIDGQWESDHGHAHAALRYGLLAPAAESDEPPPVPADPRAALIEDIRTRRSQRRDNQEWE